MEQEKLASYVEEKEREAKPNFIMKGLMKMIGKDFSLGEDNNIPTSNDSYLYTRYGKTVSTKERLADLMIDFMNVIKQKQQINEYACVKEIPIDLLDFEVPIVETFKNKGYTCHSICQRTGFDVARLYIFICWDIYHHSKTDDNVNVDDNNETKSEE